VVASRVSEFGRADTVVPAPAVLTNPACIPRERSTPVRSRHLRLTTDPAGAVAA
jgi:hypothetical protein